MTAMSEMSKAMCETIAEHGPAFSDVSTDVLGEFEIVLAAYFRVVHTEMVSRGVDLGDPGFLWAPAKGA